MQRLSTGRAIVLGISLIGLLFSLLLFQLLRSGEQRLALNQLAQQSVLLSEAVISYTKQSRDILAGIRGLFLASDFVSREEFAIFTRPLLVEHPELLALEWIPRISAAERPAYERSVRSEGFAGFSINERSQGATQPATARPFYYPVTYLEPLAGNDQALGYDLGSDPSRLDTLRQAVQREQMQMSPPLKLLQASDDDWGMLLLLPVFSSPDDNDWRARSAALSLDDPRLIGFVLGVFRIDQLMLAALETAGAELNSIHLRLYNPATDSDRLLFEVDQLRGELSVMRHALTIPLAGQQWRLELIAGRTFVNHHRSYEPLLMGAVAGLMTLLLAFWLRHQLLHEAEIRHLVARRTRELGTSEARVRAILDTAVDAIISIDARGRIQLFNPGAESLFGYQANEVTGRNVNCLMPDPHRSDHDGYLDRYLGGGEAHVIGVGREVEGMHKDGSLLALHLSVGAARVEGETLFVAVLKDMRLERERRLALTQAKELAERMNHQQAAFVNTISHELRTPLTVILGYLPLLKNRTSPLPVEAVVEIADEMDQSGHHLLDLINDILDLSKIEAQRLTLFPQSLDLAEQVQAVFKRFAMRAQERKVELIESCAKITMDADPKRLLQILTNLVGNALKFTQAGQVRVAAQQQGDWVLLSVSDSGIGIAEDQLGEIFTPFYQVDNSRTRSAGGTGLGLAITQQLVALHGGRISVSSTPGEGTCFTLYLPLKQPTEQCSIERVREDVHGQNLIG